MEGLGLESAARIDPPPIEQFKWGLALVDGATVPSVRLVDDWSRFTNVHKVMDYINTHHYPVSDQTHGDEIWIGLGSRVENECLEKSGLLAAMENVCRKHPRVKFVMSETGGAHLKINIKPEQLKLYSPCSFEDWVGILLCMDIGLMPVFGDYDLRLGSYDLLEFMISRIPWIASKETNFHNLSQYGQWVSNTPEAWETVIINTMEQLDVYRGKAAGEPFLFALNQDIHANIARILKVYSSIISR
jgi:hypothetical protein